MLEPVHLVVLGLSRECRQDGKGNTFQTPCPWSPRSGERWCRSGWPWHYKRTQKEGGPVSPPPTRAPGGRRGSGLFSPVSWRPAEAGQEADQTGHSGAEGAGWSSCRSSACSTPTHHRGTCEIPRGLSRVGIPAPGLYPLVPTPAHSQMKSEVSTDKGASAPHCP